MLLVLRLLSLCLTLLAGAAGAADIKPFASEDMASDAIRLTETLRSAAVSIGAQAKGKKPQLLPRRRLRSSSTQPSSRPLQSPRRQRIR